MTYCKCNVKTQGTSDQNNTKSEYEFNRKFQSTASLPAVMVHNSLRNNRVPALAAVVGRWVVSGCNDGDVCAIYSTCPHWIVLCGKTIDSLPKPYHSACRQTYEETTSALHSAVQHRTSRTIMHTVDTPTLKKKKNDYRPVFTWCGIPPQSNCKSTSGSRGY